MVWEEGVSGGYMLLLWLLFCGLFCGFGWIKVFGGCCLMVVCYIVLGAGVSVSTVAEFHWHQIPCIASIERWKDLMCIVT